MKDGILEFFAHWYQCISTIILLLFVAALELRDTITGRIFLVSAALAYVLVIGNAMIHCTH